MKLSKRGAMALLAEEAIVLHAYLCSAERWTIGAGHTADAGPPVPKRGMTITLEQALELFRKDVVSYEQDVMRAIKVPLAQHQFDALVLLHYNTGAIATGSVDDKLNRGDTAAALATWAQYIKGGAGLPARRAREIAMFKSAKYFERAILVEEADGRKRNVMPSSLPWPDQAPAPQPKPVTPVSPAPAPVPLPRPETPPAATPAPLPREEPEPPKPGASIAAWVMGAAATLIAALAAWIMKG